MPFYGTLESLLSYSKPSTSSYLALPSPGDAQAGSVEPLEKLLAEKVRSLSDILGDIMRDIGSRVELSCQIGHLISQQYCYLKTKLFELYTWAVGSNRSIETRRVRIEQQLDTLNHEQRQELVSAWQDIAALKTEFRTWLKQYSDLVQRVRLVLGEDSTGKRRVGRFRQLRKASGVALLGEQARNWLTGI